MLSLIEKYETCGLQLEIDERESAPSVSVLVKRARLGYKIEFNYRYGSVARMIAHVEEFLAGLERADQWKEDRKIARAAASICRS